MNIIHVKDLRIMKYYVDSVDNITDAEFGNTISGEINFEDSNKQKNIRIYVIWDDINGEMTNEEDSTAGHEAEEKPCWKESEPLSMPINSISSKHLSLK